MQRGDPVNGFLISILELVVVAVTLSKIGSYLIERQLMGKGSYIQLYNFI
jgi:hypothetical protein